LEEEMVIFNFWMYILPKKGNLKYICIATRAALGFCVTWTAQPFSQCDMWQKGHLSWIFSLAWCMTGSWLC
jgi:hypothetical protein